MLLMVSCIERISSILLSHIPIYYELKLAAIVWLFPPFFGAHATSFCHSVSILLLSRSLARSLPLSLLCPPLPPPLSLSLSLSCPPLFPPHVHKEARLPYEAVILPYEALSYYHSSV